MIRVRIGPLHEAEGGAILRPVNSELAAVTAAGREIETRIGDSVLQRLEDLGGLPVGGALMTAGGDLTVPFLIHVVVQSADEPVTEAGIRNALVNGLRRACEWEMDELAMPPLGTGAGNFDPEASARIMIPILVDHLAENEHPRTVTIIAPNEYEDEIFRRTLETPS